MEYPINMKKYLISAVGIILFASLAYGQTNKPESWEAPATADELKNNYASENDLNAGKQTFDMYCWSCHGKEGLGDGPAGGALPIKPKNFADVSITKQSDGALYWKLSNGRGNMIGYGSMLSEEKRWQLITYIRSINNKATADKSN